MAQNATQQPITKEILASDRISSYMAFTYNMPGMSLPDDPSWTWEQLRWNPWIAQAIYDDIEEKDDKIGGDLETRKENVLSKPRVVVPGGDKRQDAKLAAFVEETLEGYMGGSLVGDRLPFDNVLWEAMEAIGKGVAIGETIWNASNDRVFIEDVRFKPQHLFSFGDGPLGQYGTYAHLQTGPLRIRPGLMIEGVDIERPLPDRKFFVHTFRPRQGNRWGMPVIRKCFWLSWFKRAGLKQWLRLLEKGPGTTVTRYDGSASSGEKQLALDAAQAISEEMSVAVPKKFEIEVLEHVRGQMSGLHEGLVDDFCNNGIARVILGQTLTSRGSEGGGSRALGEVHERVAGKKTEVDCKSLMLAVNTQLVWPIVLFNQGPVPKPPIWTIKYEPGADLKLMTDILYRLWTMRVPIKKDYVYNTMQIPEPAEGDEVLEPPAKGDPTDPPGDSEGEDAAFAEGDEVKKKVREQAAEAANLEEGALREAAPVYDRILTTLIDQIDTNDETSGVPSAALDRLNSEFSSVVAILGDGLLAAYLLGAFHVQEVGGTPAFPVKTIQFQDLIQHAFNVPPKEAIVYLEKKKVVKRKVFDRLKREAKSGAFTVGGVYKEDVLAGFKSELSTALTVGKTQAATVKRFRDILAGAGHKQLGEFHLETVFRTNMQTAYGVGRRRALEEVVEDLPIWEYHAVMDDRTRPTHAALNGIMLPANHEFWSTHFAPWDFNCRCSVTASSEIPADYNPRNPSGEAELSYDRHGMPAKAEYGTTLYDLQAGSFSGVPKGATLKSAVEAGVERARKGRK